MKRFLFPIFIAGLAIVCNKFLGVDGHFVIYLILVLFLSGGVFLSCDPHFFNFTKKVNINKNDISSEFDLLYNILLEDYLSPLENTRKKLARQGAGLSIATVAIMFVPAGLYNYGEIVLKIGSFLIFIIIFIFAASNLRLHKKYADFYKEKIISNFVYLVDNRLKYEPNTGCISKFVDWYKKAQFKKIEANDYAANDYISGQLGDSYIEMCDLNLKRTTGSGRNKNTTKLFCGMFVHTTTDKGFDGYIKVLGQKMFKERERFEIDSQEFERLFDVSSSDKMKAMQFLTADILMLFVDFKNRYKIDFEVAFFEGNICLRFMTGPMFEPQVFHCSMNKNMLYRYYVILNFVVNLTKILQKEYGQGYF